MSTEPDINLTIDLVLDENNRPSTDPSHVVKFTQQMLFKAVLDKTSNGTHTPDDMKDLAVLLRDMNNTALTSRKLDQEEQMIGNQKSLVEAYKQFEVMFKGQNVYNPEGVESNHDPYSGLKLPDIEINQSELSQGEQMLNPDEFISDD